MRFWQGCKQRKLAKVIIFSVLDYLGSGLWEKKNFPETSAARFLK
jgi:hypothetical protein